MNRTCALLACALFACGGKAFSAEIPDGSVDASIGDGAADGSANDGAPGRDATADAAATCSELSVELEMLRTSARKCCPTCNIAQCDRAAADLCCPISYDSANQAAVDELERALKAFEMQCGVPSCPAIPCPAAPSGICDPNTSLCR